MYRYVDKRTQKRCTVYADDLPELREKEKKIERDEQDGILTDVQTKNMTVNQLFERYLATRRLKEYTRNDYVSMWNHHVAGEIGNAKVIELRSSDIKKLYNKLSELGLAYETIKYIHNMLAPTMELAVEDDIIRKNPAKNTLSKKYGKTPKPKKPLTKEQQEKLLEFVKDSKVYSVHYNMLVLFLECMNRRGEIAGLNESEIDFKNRVINVDH